jgi:hypothetical protein
MKTKNLGYAKKSACRTRDPFLYRHVGKSCITGKILRGTLSRSRCRGTTLSRPTGEGRGEGDSLELGFGFAALDAFLCASVSLW